MLSTRTNPSAYNALRRLSAIRVRSLCCHFPLGNEPLGGLSVAWLIPDSGDEQLIQPTLRHRVADRVGPRGEPLSILAHSTGRSRDRFNGEDVGSATAKAAWDLVRVSVANAKENSNASVQLDQPGQREERCVPHNGKPPRSVRRLEWESF